MAGRRPAEGSYLNLAFAVPKSAFCARSHGTGYISEGNGGGRDAASCRLSNPWAVRLLLDFIIRGISGVISALTVAAPMTVLQVDDNPDDVARFRRLVRSLDWHVLSAGNAAECLGVVGAARPDVIILDYNLGDSYGTDLLVHLRRAGVRTPAIVQSSLPGALQTMGGLPPSAAGFISKNSPDYHKEIIELIQATAIGREGPLRPEPWFSGDSWATIDEVLRSLVEQASRLSSAGFARSRNSVTSAQFAISGTASTADLEGLGRLAKASPRLAAPLAEARARATVIEFEGSRVCLASIGSLGTLFASCSDPADHGDLGRDRFETAVVALTSLTASATNGLEPRGR